MKRPSIVLLPLVVAVACTPKLPVDRSVHVGDKTTVDVQDVPAKGFDVDVSHAYGSESGELLGINPCWLYLLDDDKTIAISSRMVDRVSIEVYPGKSGYYTLWTVVGATSTLSHGFFLVFSLPVWLAVGIPTSISTANANDTILEGDGGRLFQYARFPQGLPAGWKIDRTVGQADPSCTAPPPPPAPPSPPPASP